MRRICNGVLPVFIMVLCAGYASSVTESAETVNSGAAERSGASDASDNGRDADVSVKDLFLKEYFIPWRDDPDNKLFKSVLEYQRRRKDLFGRISITRTIISPSNRKESANGEQDAWIMDIFGVVQALGDSSRIHNVEKAGDHVFKLVLLGAVRVTEHGQRAVVKAEVICQFFMHQGKPLPRRFIFTGDVPKESGLTVRWVQIVYTWEGVPFHDETGEGSNFWLVSEIEITQEIQRGPHRPKLRELWKITNVLEVIEGQVQPVRHEWDSDT